MKRVGKVPAVSSWKEFQETPPSDETIRRWFSNGHKRNIGIPTGRVSGVVVLDGDSPESVGAGPGPLAFPFPLSRSTCHEALRLSGSRLRGFQGDRLPPGKACREGSGAPGRPALAGG
ncbi:MAG: hypothetical protein FJ202_10205 [Gemmatimonadetes bacterium]|nr:hypothetical protein [Gemmatimonadota bacterium]